MGSVYSVDKLNGTEFRLSSMKSVPDKNLRVYPTIEKVPRRYETVHRCSHLQYPARRADPACPAHVVGYLSQLDF